MWGVQFFYNSISSINEQKLNTLIKSENLKISLEGQASLIKKQYLDPDNAFKDLSQIIGSDKLSKIEMTKILNLIEVKEKWGFMGFRPIESTLYMVLTFCSLIFIIAGLYIKEITRIRLGAIELDKTSGQQVTISSSLGITR